MKINLNIRRCCPKTAGQPVSITRRGWDKVCAAARAEAHGPVSGWKGGPKGEGSLLVSPCLDCTGEIPAEVTFIQLHNINQEEGMASDTRVAGICEYCGKKKQVAERFGKKICSMCENVRCGIRANPQMVIASLKELAPTALPAGSGNDAELRKLRSRIEELTAHSNEQEALLERRLNELEEVHMELKKVKAEINDHPPVAQLESLLSITIDQRPLFTDLALRLAIGTMRGEIEGIEADDIELLRSI